MALHRQRTRSRGLKVNGLVQERVPSVGGEEIVAQRVALCNEGIGILVSTINNIQRKGER
jgi:hypothetical protein